MNKRTLLAILAVFLAWSIMDVIIHGMLLQSIYVATASMWRPPEEMNMRMMHVVLLICASAFVLIYASLAGNRSVGTGILYGILFGIATGISMGFGTYCVMPIPLSLAWGWALGHLAETTVAGAIVGAIVKS